MSFLSNIFNKKNSDMQDLFDQTIKNNSGKFSTLLFNLYEDMNGYTAEIVFDDEKSVIGRDNPFFISGKNKTFKDVLSDFKICLAKFYQENKKELSNLKEISYGFVDGDLYYIKKPKQNKSNDAKITMEEIRELDDFRLLCWITVYTELEKREECGIVTFQKKELTECEREKYRKFLYENFTTEKVK